MQPSDGRRDRPGRRGDEPHPIDIHIGARVRLRRAMLGLSQEQLGKALGVPTQRVGKYEGGNSRIGASVLLEIAQVLQVPIAFFYDDLDPVWAPPTRSEGESGDGDPFHHPEAVALLAAFYGIDDPTVRGQVVALTRVLATGSPYRKAEDVTKPIGEANVGTTADRSTHDRNGGAKRGSHRKG